MKCYELNSTDSRIDLDGQISKSLSDSYSGKISESFLGFQCTFQLDIKSKFTHVYCFTHIMLLYNQFTYQFSRIYQCVQLQQQQQQLIMYLHCP